MPVELVRMICSYLTPTQVASIRSISRTIAAIGLEYIATTVTLTLNEESFDRLLDIAHHPVVSKYVQNLRYEHDFLADLTRTQWESIIKTPEYMAAQANDTILQPLTAMTARGWRSFHRERSFYEACNKYGKKRLDQAYSTYQNHRAEQDYTRRSNFFLDKLADGLKGLPKLKRIYMPVLGSYSRYQREIAELLDGADYDQSVLPIRSDSAAVTRSILLAIDRAVCDSRNRNTQVAMVGNGAALGARSRHLSDTIDEDPAGSNRIATIPNDRDPSDDCLERSDLEDSNQGVPRIKNFSSESLNWRLFLQDEKIFRVMKRSISHLNTLDINLLDECWMTDTRPSFRIAAETEAPRECLRRGLLHEFVTSAPMLEELSVSIGLNWTRFKITLTHLVGSFHWTSLKKFHIQRMSIGIGDLEEFCSRHSATLAGLSLGGLDFYNVPPIAGKICPPCLLRFVRPQN